MSDDRIRRQHRFTITPEHLILDPRVSDRAMRLWCRLDRYAGDNDVAFPSRETLAIELDCSPSSIDRALTDLVESGWLKKERRAQGDVNVYVLIVAPEKATQRLIEDARKARIEATAPRRETAANRRREAKRAAKVQQSSNAQVGQGGVVTSDETPAGGGVVTGDETPLVTGDERGVVTHDEEKEATLEGGNKEGDSETSLRSVSPSADPEPPTLTLVAQTLDGPATEKPVETPQQQAYRIVREFADWFETQTHAPIVNRTRTIEALRKSYVTPALEAGADEKQIKLALASTGYELPAQSIWRRELRKAMGGENLPTASAFEQRKAYSNDSTWGTAEQRQAEAERTKDMTEEEIAAEVAAALAPTSVHRPAPAAVRHG